MRAHPRINKLRLTAVERIGDLGEVADEAMGRTLNISEGGILLEMVKPLPLLSTVSLSIGLGDMAFHVEGEVVHLRKSAEGKIETGIQFSSITDEERELIRKNL